MTRSAETPYSKETPMQAARLTLRNLTLSDTLGV